MYLHIYRCRYTFRCICRCICRYICRYICRHICRCICRCSLYSCSALLNLFHGLNLHIATYACICICICKCTYVYMYVCIYTYIYTCGEEFYQLCLFVFGKCKYVYMTRPLGRSHPKVAVASCTLLDTGRCQHGSGSKRGHPPAL